MFDRLNLAMLPIGEAFGTPQARRARLTRRRMNAVILFVLFAILGVLQYRRIDSKLAWLVFVGLMLFILVGRIYYTPRQLYSLDEPEQQLLIGCRLGDVVDDEVLDLSGAFL